jgi:hypothetical protein
MRSLLLALYGDPTGLLARASAERHFWLRLWLFVATSSFLLLGTATVVVVTLAPAAAASMVGYGALPVVTLMLGSAFALTTTRHARLWLLYAYSPPATAAALPDLSGVLR